MPYINEAVYVLQEGIATREDIDTTMKLGTNVPLVRKSYKIHVRFRDR